MSSILRTPLESLQSLALAGLVLAGSSACAAHNSHRVNLDPLQTLPSLVDQALAQLEQQLGEPLPADSVVVALAVEPVSVTWPVPPDAVQPAGSFEVQPVLLDSVSQRIAVSEPANARYELTLALQIDLSEPDVMGLRVVCDLYGVGEKKRRSIACGASEHLVVERLYCHGCRDGWGGKGTNLDGADPDGSSVSYGGEVGYLYIPTCWSGSSSGGYTKH